jgi:radical SAM enzyme (TIGR01210 family)
MTVRDGTPAANELPAPVELPTTQWILQQRGTKNHVDPTVPYSFLLEEETSLSAAGQAIAVERAITERVATIFLTNRECPFHCTMCDLWKNTTDETVPLGAIPGQIEYALARLAQPDSVKLYNSGNFFDRHAIPREDWGPIAGIVRQFRRVIVESHPRLLDGVETFQKLILPAQLEVALGLETVHPQVLPALNKQMTLDDFSSACQRLTNADIPIRAFILLRPPWLSEAEGCEWALRTIQFAFSHGVECCSVVPTRDGNGAMESLGKEGRFHPPRLESMERVLAAGLQLGRGRVLMDTWEMTRFRTCDSCDLLRVEQIERMNREQTPQAAVRCPDCE